MQVFPTQMTISDPSGDSRELMLAAAWDMIVESFGFGGDEPRKVEAKVLEQLKAADIAHRAGLSTGAFYNRWPNREAFLTEFIDYALSVDRSPTYNVLKEIVGSFDGEPDELVRQIAREDIKAIVANPAFAIHTHLWSMMRSRNDIGARMEGMYEEYREESAPLFAALLDALDRDVHPAFTMEEMVQFLMALSEGLSLQVAAGGSGAPDEDFLGKLILAIMPSLTVPR